jgi:hypothetical protein
MLRRPDLRRALRRRRPPLGGSAAGAGGGATGSAPPFRTTRPLGFIPSLRSVLRIVFAETLRWLLRWRRPPIVGPTTGAEFPADPFSEPAFAYASICFIFTFREIVYAEQDWHGSTVNFWAAAAAFVRR